MTTKDKADEHGYGLSNIRRVAAKYMGDIVAEIRDETFCLSVLLMMDKDYD